MKEYEKIKNIKKIIKYGTCGSIKILGKDRDCSEICQFCNKGGDCSFAYDGLSSIIGKFKNILNRKKKLNAIKDL